SFNPAMRIGRQLAEVAEVHAGARRRVALARAVQRLWDVHIPAPARRASQFPHELSGGMRQRAMIGMGLMGTPKLLVADEPTTALDVTVQREVLRLVREVQRGSSLAVLLISHDVAVVSQLCQRVLVMYAGRIVEDLPTADLTTAAHPYTRALIAAVPSMLADRGRPLATIPGQPPEPASRPSGCAFAPRCPFADEHCGEAAPPLVDLAPGHRAACWHPQLARPLAAARGS
ncbi:MAG: ATP-binding cassette domain-containing protein, partial [Micromonosporaceae bacterium]|nr:ATP-binding cassette domain-containing protein [Micromonosporaceae bacterium]